MNAESFKKGVEIANLNKDIMQLKQDVSPIGVD